MKTITPIRIEAKSKELILDVSKRALTNAALNCCIVRLVVGAVECLVYPNDNLAKVIHYVKLQSVLIRMKELQA